MSLCLIDVHGDIEGDFEWAEELPRITNGDVIKSLFPNCLINEGESFVSFWYTKEENGRYVNFRKSWWNAPYKENKK